jgi:hypothetical protein
MTDLEKWQFDCLVDYVNQRMTVQQFAAHVGVSRPIAYKILTGRVWTLIPRPEGFAYPWPENRNPTRVHRERKQLYEAGVKLFFQHNWSYRRLAEHLNVPLQTAYDAVQRVRKSMPSTVDATSGTAAESLPE